MNGPEHYREAERVLDHAEENACANSEEWYANAMRAAQVHATLALAAAMADPQAMRTHGESPGTVDLAWAEAIS